VANISVKELAYSCPLSGFGAPEEECEENGENDDWLHFEMI
jgi:hypothetical protein